MPGSDRRFAAPTGSQYARLLTATCVHVPRSEARSLKKYALDHRRYSVCPVGAWISYGLHYVGVHPYSAGTGDYRRSHSRSSGAQPGSVKSTPRNPTNQPERPEPGKPALSRIVRRNIRTMMRVRLKAFREQKPQDQIANAIPSFSGSMVFVYLPIAFGF